MSRNAKGSALITGASSGIGAIYALPSAAMTLSGGARVR
jgi:short-subunit dehydrogenase